MTSMKSITFLVTDSLSKQEPGALFFNKEQVEVYHWTPNFISSFIEMRSQLQRNGDKKPPQVNEYQNRIEYNNAQQFFQRLQGNQGV